MVDSIGDKTAPFTASVYAPFEDGAQWFLYGGIAATTLLSILSDHHSVRENGKDHVSQLIYRPFRPLLSMVAQLLAEYPRKIPQ